MAAGPSRETGTRYPREDAPPRTPAAPPAGGDWRSAVMTASGLNVLAGIWLIIAPFVLGYGDGDPYWNDIVFGAIVAVLGLARVSGAYRAAWLSWINAAIGAWIFISAWWLDDTSTAAWNDVIAGAVIFVLALLSASASDEGAARTTTAWYRR
jgi:hypothetical protein